MHNPIPLLEDTDFPKIMRGHLNTLQVNIGLKCNQQCVHCHVNAGPKRTEAMSRETINIVLDFIRNSPGIKTLDITGGAPELHPDFRYLVREASQYEIEIIDRCNLTVLIEKGQENLAEFLAVHGVNIIASLPCYSEENVDRQRGKGVFDKSITALQLLNKMGYGRSDQHHTLDLVYNPQGPVLPPDQVELQNHYKQILGEKYSIEFNRLFVLCNMPINRFGSMLISNNQFHDYMSLLKNSFNGQNLQDVMCRSLLSVDWQGYVYDCDFNQMLNLNMQINENGKTHLKDLFNREMENMPIRVMDHCFGCTAGQGSSCGGALTNS